MTRTVYQYTLLRVTNHLDEFINVALIVVDLATKEHGFVTHKNIERALALVDLDIFKLTSCISSALDTVDLYIHWDTAEPSTLDPNDPTTWSVAQGMFQFRSYLPVMADSIQDAIDKLAETFDMHTL